MNNRPGGLRRLLWPLVLSCALSLVAAAPARAGVLVSSVPAASCSSQVLTQPFVPWLDHFDYTLVPRGNFEGGTGGWSLKRASLVKDNESHYVGARTDTRSLSLGASGSAQSPAMCASIYHPVLRLFVRNRGSLASALAVDVLYEDARGRVRSLTIGAVSGTGSWQPTLPVAVVANLLPLLPNDQTALAFRFRATGIGGDWRIDDVYLDPHRRS